MFAGHTDVVPPGDEATWHHPPFAGEVGRRQDLRPRRRRYEGRHRLLRCGSAGLSRRQRRPAEAWFDFASDHRRRRGRCGQRHDQAAAMGGRTRRELRPLHPRRAEQRRGRSATPSRPGRRGSLSGTLIVTGRQGHVAYPASRRQPDPRARHAHCRAAGAARRRQRAFRSVASRNLRRSMSATKPSISFPGRRARVSTSATTIATARSR